MMAIDSKVPSSYFGSGNVGIYGVFDAKYISVVYNIDHFEDLNFPLVNKCIPISLIFFKNAFNLFE